MIRSQIMERDCTSYPEGIATCGTLVDYGLTGPLVFGPPKGEGLWFQVPFESRGVASGACHTSEGENYTYARDGSIVGMVFLEMGPDTLISEGLDEVLGGTQIEVAITDAETDDLCPSACPPKKLVGES